MAYFSLDCEASGPLPPQYNLLSIGVTVVRKVGDCHELGESFYVELKPIFPGFDPRALRVCGLDPERLRVEGLHPRTAMEQLSEFVAEQNRGEVSDPVFVAHNAVFDWAYIAQYYAHYGLPNPFGYKGIDTKSLAMGKLGVSWNATNKERLRKLLELPRQDPKQVHRADYDAWFQALMLQKLLDL